MSEKIQHMHKQIRGVSPDFFTNDSTSNRRPKPGITAIRVLLCLFLSTSMPQAVADQTTFDPNQDGSLAVKTIKVSRSGDWAVLMCISNSAHDLQKQFADKVLQTGAPRPNGKAAQAPTLPIHLLLTVTGVYGTALRVIQEFEIYQEILKQSSRNTGTTKACFSVKQLNLNKGFYTAALRVMEAEPELEGFEASLLVENVRK